MLIGTHLEKTVRTLVWTMLKVEVVWSERFMMRDRPVECGCPAVAVPLAVSC